MTAHRGRACQCLECQLFETGPQRPALREVVMDDIERCAQLLGMRRREIIEVVPVDGGDLVQTHDGSWTLIGADGELTFGVAGPTAAVEADEACEEMLGGF